jgi:acetylornithine deacetylase/succinyl-diaminopimelate desuccinylase-like protein
MLTHLKAAEAWLKTAGTLPVNVKFIIEGEEEVGGASLEDYMARQAGRLACDYAVISDTSQLAPGIPAITYGLKGLAYFELLVQGANRDLHSGTYGGAVANPINALCAILASLKGPDGRILITEFYDAVGPLEDWERAGLAEIPFSEADFRATSGPALAGEASYSHLERKWARPTCDINRIFGVTAAAGPRPCSRERPGPSSASASSPTRTPKWSSASSGTTSRGSALRA